MKVEDKSLLEQLLALATASFAVGFLLRRKENAARKWPQVPGTIVTCETVQQAGPQPGTEMVTPLIEYEFNYEGRLFKSSHWRFGNFSVGNSASAQAALARYPLGSSVTVYVNVRQPMKSVLEHQPSSLCWVPFGLGIIFLAVLIMALLYFTMTPQR